MCTLPFIDISLFRYFELVGGETAGVVFAQVILMLAWAIVAIAIIAEDMVKD
jgi:hypothetical protein